MWSMRQLRNRGVAASLVLAGLAGVAKADFSYFFLFGEPTTEVTKQSSAVFVDGQYQITTGAGQGGAIWRNTKQDVAGGFVCYVRFRIENEQGDPVPDYIPGDGFALVVSGNATMPVSSAATGGSGLGYNGFTRAAAFEIDTFGFGGEFEAPHASIQMPATPTGVLTSDDVDSVGNAELNSGENPIDVLNFNEHTMVVQYVPPLAGEPASLQIWVDDRLQVSSATDLTNLADSNGQAWIGITAGTGLANSVHKIAMWDFRGNTGACAEPRWFGAYTGSGCGLPSGPCNLVSGVSVSGSRPLTYTWTRDGAPITDDDGGRIIGLGTTDINITNAGPNDHAFYSVEFSNVCGSSSFGPNFIADVVNCNSVDFNNDQLFPDSGDLDDFIAVLSGGPSACSTGECDPLDFNNDELFPDSLDLDAIISRLGGGPCVR
jgi:hypothetical protein